MIKPRFYCSTIVLILIFVVGCRNSEVLTSSINTLVPIPSRTSAIAPTRIIAPPTATTYQTQEETTPTQLPTVVVVSTSTITPTILPSWTPLPTLLPEEAQKLVIELIKTNGNCALPCWWGITPGATTFQEAHQFLSTFADEIVQGEPNTFLKDGIEYTQFNFGAHFKVPGYINIESGYGVTNGIIDSIQINSGAELRYQLFQMLNRYGVPEDVLISVEPGPPLGTPYFWMAVFYPQKGIYAFFEGETKLQDGKVLICSQGLGPTLLLIPMGEMTLDEMERTFLNHNIRASMRSIRRATGMELEDFYTELKYPGACIKVIPFNTSLWPLY